MTGVQLSFSVELVQTPNNFPKTKINGDFKSAVNYFVGLLCQIIKLQIVYFKTERNFDSLDIYDGSSSSAQLVASLSGSYDSPLFVISTQRYMFVRFTTDDAVVSNGFNVTFISTYSPGKMHM